MRCLFRCFLVRAMSLCRVSSLCVFLLREGLFLGRVSFLLTLLLTLKVFSLSLEGLEDGWCDFAPSADQTQTSARPTQIGKFSVAHGCGIHWRPTLDRARDRDVSRWARAHAKLSLS